jgi:serine/threonine-protein kinase
MANQLIANYRVIRLLGEGGMGLVYEAVRDDIGVRAAVKVLRPEYAHNAELAGRFINEARAANMVQHPGLVRVFDYGRLPTGEPYLAMEFLEGVSLRARMMRDRPLGEGDAMRLGRQIAAAVGAAHAKQIVHRDLKPENVMIIDDADAPGGERAKVLDFGIAKLETGAPSQVRTRTNTMMGTPVYMAPEQCRGLKTITDRADVYSLGVISSPLRWLGRSSRIHDFSSGSNGVPTSFPTLRGRFRYQPD